MMKRSAIVRVAAAIAALTVLVVIGTVVFVSTGAYNVAATVPHARLTRWLMKTVQERSVAVRADEVPPAPALDSGTLSRGLEEYGEMCVVCHGAPGVERGMLGKGINPEPPDLAQAAAEWSDQQLFWIIRNGIKMAGMPAFGVTHADERLWDIVAFLRQLQELTPEEYRRLAAAAPPPTEMHGAEAHAHAEVQETETHAGAQGETSQPLSGGQATDHPLMEHPGAADVRVGTAAQVTADQDQRGMTGMDHSSMPSRPPLVAQTGAAPAPVDADATEKLKMLATELVRDPVVLQRIQADSALRRRWDDEKVRDQLAPRPR